MHFLATINGEPLFRQLKDRLKEGIIREEYQPSERLPSQVKLAKEFGVSQITVRRAIQELVNEGLLVAHSGSGTYVATPDQVRNAAGSKTIAVIFEDIVGGYPLVKPLFAAIRQKCKESNYILQFVELPESSDGNSMADNLPELDIAGAILTSPCNVPMLARIVEMGIPHVLLHNDVADGTSYSVSCNYASGIMQAALHLMEQGCRNMLLITAEQKRYSAGQMELGFELAFRAAANKKCSREIIHASYEEEKTYEIIKQRLDSKNLPDGLILASDGMAKAAVNALLQAGVSIPEDIAVVSFGNTLKPYDAPLEISAVDARNEKTGETAINVLHQIITGKMPEEHRFITEPELIARASSLRK